MEQSRGLQTYGLHSLELWFTVEHLVKFWAASFILIDVQAEKLNTAYLSLFICAERMINQNYLIPVLLLPLWVCGIQNRS